MSDQKPSNYKTACQEEAKRWTSTTKTLCLQALGNMQGDDLYRARQAFRGMTPEQMQEQHGQSGLTRAEILAEYEAHDTKVSAAIKEVESL